MITEDQQEVIRCLTSPGSHGGEPVETIETHASIVFLAGRLAWKLKRAVRYDYLDFSTAARRRAMCEAELRLNRRSAPSLYHRVVPVTREADGALALAGAGPAVDWVLEMSRFDQENLLDQLASRHTLDMGLMRPLGAAIARLHAGAEHRRDHGGASGMTWVVDGNEAACQAQPPQRIDVDVCRRVAAASRAAIEQHRQLLDARRDGGFVRQCHGDLHLRNIVRLAGVPTPFDGVEFNDEIACIDVMYDLAFLLMDLWRRSLAGHANAVCNAYLAETDDLEGLALLPLFLSCRAAIRAKTGAAAAMLQQDAARQAELWQGAREYLAMARTLLNPRPARVIAVGGVSGSGKSTLAFTLAPQLGPVPGAVVIRSDDIRKRLFGLDPLARLGAGAYTDAVSTRVYAAAIERAVRAVRAGHTAMVDGVFANAGDRSAIERAAQEAGVPFSGVWLDAPLDTLLQRVEQRRGDASDADAAVVRAQVATDIGLVTWRRFDAGRSVGALVGEVLPALIPLNA
jgi:aminoglycoside phosphotransferase family enzyme/predicted kinase